MAKDPNPNAQNMGGILDCIEIKPHSTYSEKLFLPLWIEFEHASRYLVHAKRPLQLYAKSSPNCDAAFTNSGTFDFYVTVLPANSNLLGKRIQQWGEQSKTPAGAEDAAWALAYIDDERVIPHLTYIAETYKGGGPLSGAVEGLARHPGADSTRALIKMLDNPEYPYFQDVVIEALVKMKTLEAKGALLKSLNSPEAFIRAESAKALMQIGDRDSMDALKAHLKDNDSSVRLACAEALAHLGAFEKGSNSAVILAQILDTTNPSATNRYNDVLFELIASSGGPSLSYNFAFHRESTEREMLENKKALAAMLRWANSSNAVPER